MVVVLDVCIYTCVVSDVFIVVGVVARGSSKKTNYSNEGKSRVSNCDESNDKRKSITAYMRSDARNVVPARGSDGQY